MKKTLSIILALVLSLLMIPVGIISGAAVGEVETGYTPAAGSVAISSVAEFERIGTGDYYLTQDLDFSGKTYTNNIIAKLIGSLDGCGHSITGITISSTNSDAGIIAEISGSVKNLIVGTAASPAKISSTGSGKTVSGLIAVAKTANVSVENVKLYAEVSSVSTSGGVIGYLAASTAVIKNCEINGSINANGGAVSGGIVGRIKNSENIYAENCVNNANVTLSTGGTDWGAGGIFGCIERGVTAINCVNRGNVTTNANYAGGIIGFMSMNEGVGTVLVQKCSNYGTISGMNTGKQSDGSYQLTPETRYAAIGGIIGGDKDFQENRENTITIDKCMNYGLVKTNGTSAGAIMGKGTLCRDGEKTLKIVIKDTGNIGRVEYGKTDVEVGTFISVASTNSVGSLSISNCYNMGTTNSTKAYAGVYNMVGDSTIGDTAVSDFYFLDTAYFWAANAGNVAISNAAACTAEQFASGEVAYNLGFNFGQIIGTQSYPIPGEIAVVATGSVSAPFANLRRLATKANRASASYVQTTEVDTQGKQIVRFIVAVDSEALESAASAQMVITFKKAGSDDISYTLKNDEIKFFKSIKADGELYLADEGCAILGAVVTGVGSEVWSSVEITFTVKDAAGAEIALMSTSGAYSK